MKKKIIYFSLLTAAIGFGAAENRFLKSFRYKMDMTSTFQKNPNNFYFGPEVFWFDLNTNFKDVRVHGSKTFLGLRLGYEYLKPNAFYFESLFYLRVQMMDFMNYTKGEKFPKVMALWVLEILSLNLDIRFLRLDG